jgi:hypothetical protein
VQTKKSLSILFSSVSSAVKSHTHTASLHLQERFVANRAGVELVVCSSGLLSLIQTEPDDSTNNSIFTYYLSTMADYQLVERHEIEHHNEYYEVRTTSTDEPRSLFFTTNEENLETVAADIVAAELPGAKSWTVIPHRKDS